MAKPNLSNGRQEYPDRNVHILATGGTISNITGDYRSRSSFVSMDEVLDRAPESVSAIAPLTFSDISHLSSNVLTPKIWFRLISTIEELTNSEDQPDGFVVTHGSNTAEETAYFLHLAANTDRPIVVTAAQRNIGGVGTDGFQNLEDAIRVAADPESVGRGSMLVANREIHGARDVSKLICDRPDGWRSPNTGRLGSLVKGVEFYSTLDRPATSETEFDLNSVSPEEFPLTNIQIVYTSFAANGKLVRLALEDGDIAGIVVSAFPTAGAARPEGYPKQSDALKDAVSKGIPVVMCSRGLEEYGTPDEAFISGSTLRPQKARILLALGLLKTSNHTKLQELFDTY